MKLKLKKKMWIVDVNKTWASITENWWELWDWTKIVKMCKSKQNNALKEA